MAVLVLDVPPMRGFPRHLWTWNTCGVISRTGGVDTNVAKYLIWRGVRKDGLYNQLFAHRFGELRRILFSV
jgi:hypothetical protein